MLAGAHLLKHVLINLHTAMHHTIVSSNPFKKLPFGRVENQKGEQKKQPNPF